MTNPHAISKKFFKNNDTKVVFDVNKPNISKHNGSKTARYANIRSPSLKN